MKPEPVAAKAPLLDRGFRRRRPSLWRRRHLRLRRRRSRFPEVDRRTRNGVEFLVGSTRNSVFKISRCQCHKSFICHLRSRLKSCGPSVRHDPNPSRCKIRPHLKFFYSCLTPVLSRSLIVNIMLPAH